MHRRTATALVALTGAVCALLVGATPVGAAKTPDACKVFKASEISSVFGVTVANGTKGLSTQINTSCNYDVPAGTGRPQGGFTVTITFLNAKPAYDGLTRFPTYVALNESGVKGVYAPPPLSVLTVLKGSKMLAVQGNFIDSNARPLGYVEVKDKLIQLAKIGIKRVVQIVAFIPHHHVSFLRT